MKKNRIFSGLIWTFGERITAQLVTTIVTIVLARILDPEHYGVVSIVTVVINLLNAFVCGGFDSALVQKKDADALDFDTAFLISISVSCICYLGLFFCAPLISDFYHMDELTPLLRVMGIRLIILSFNCIQQASIRREMKFQSFFWSTLLGTVISGVVGVVLALNGAGVWALAAQYLTNAVIDTMMLFIIGRWFPRLRFSLERAKEIWSFGWKVLVTTLVYTLEGNIRSLIVGKVFGSSDLAYYDQGNKYPSLLVTNVSASINKVMLPAYSQTQDDRERLLEMLRKSIQLGIYLLTPFLLGFGIMGKSIITVLLTEKWLPCVAFLQIFCVTYLFRPLEDSCHQALLAIGRSDIVLTCMIVINAAAVLFVIISAWVLKSVIAIAWFGLLSTMISLCVFLSAVRKYLLYSVKMQLEDIAPTMVCGLIMVAAVYGIGLLQINLYVDMALQILGGAAVYISASHIFRLKPYHYLLSFLLNGRRKNS